MNIKQYDADTHVIRSKGHKKTYKKNDGEVYYHPHIQINAMEYARTCKVYDTFKEQLALRGFDVTGLSKSKLYKRYMLILMEHIVREMKINGDHAKFVLKMSLPLDKEEYVKNKNKKGNKK